MVFYTETEPSRGEIHAVTQGISRLVANNPSKMTYHGTNTYFIDTDEGRYVVDPGPAEDEVHLNAIFVAMEKRPAGIIVSHHHSDHFGLVPRLKAATGLKVFASSVFADDTFRPDVELDDGDNLSGMTIMHTPGHASDHLCMSLPSGVVLTGDHIMTWSSSMVMLPDGDMLAYCQQLSRFLEREDTLYLPGHGPPLASPSPYTRRLLDHRERRDQLILRSIAASPSTPEQLSRTLYAKKDIHLAWAAQKNVEAHLDKLRREGRATVFDQHWSAIRS